MTPGDGGVAKFVGQRWPVDREELFQRGESLRRITQHGLDVGAAEGGVDDNLGDAVLKVGQDIVERSLGRPVNGGVGNEVATSSSQLAGVEGERSKVVAVANGQAVLFGHVKKTSKRARC